MSSTDGGAGMLDIELENGLLHSAYMFLRKRERERNTSIKLQFQSQNGEVDVGGTS